MAEIGDRQDVWVIDTSSVLEIRRKLANEKHAEIYRGLGLLVDQGKHGTSHASLRTVLAVEGVAQLLDPDKPGVEEADPYVLALAHHLIGLGLFARVITEDRVNSPEKIALASACGLVGIPVVPVRAFLLNRQIWAGAWGS